MFSFMELLVIRCSNGRAIANQFVRLFKTNHIITFDFDKYRSFELVRQDIKEKYIDYYITNFYGSIVAKRTVL